MNDLTLTGRVESKTTKDAGFRHLCRGFEKEVWQGETQNLLPLLSIRLARKCGNEFWVSTVGEG